MLTKQTIFEQLKQHKAEMENLGIRKVGLFGSYIRNEQKENSDIDILIKWEENKATLDNFLGLYSLLEGLFTNKKIDIASEDYLNKRLQPFILKEVEYV